MVEIEPLNLSCVPLSFMSTWLFLSTCQINVKNSKGGWSALPFYKRKHLKAQKERRLGVPGALCSTGTLHLLLFSLLQYTRLRLHCECIVFKLKKKWSSVPGRLPQDWVARALRKKQRLKLNCRENQMNRLVWIQCSHSNVLYNLVHSLYILNILFKLYIIQNLQQLQNDSLSNWSSSLKLPCGVQRNSKAPEKAVKKKTVS